MKVTLARAGDVCLVPAQPKVSHLLAVHREAGLVEGERRGSFAHDVLAPGGLTPLRAPLEGLSSPATAACCSVSG